MNIFRRSKMTRDEALIDRYNRLRQIMSNLQADYGNLLRESKYGKGTTPHARTSYALALGRQKEIEAVWKEIQRMGPDVGKVHVRIAKRQLKKAKGPADQLEKMKILHAREQANIGVNWGVPPSKLSRVRNAFKRWLGLRRRAA